MAQSKGIWIDDEILGDEELNPSEKIVLALLTNLCRKDGNCTATNKYISECTHYNERKIFRMLSSLEIHGYIIIEKKQSTYRSIRISTLPNMAESECQNWQSDSAKYGSPTLPLSEVSSYYREKNNNINFIKKGVPPTKEEISEYCRLNGYTFSVDYFVDYYSQVGWKRKGSAIDWRAAADYWQKHQKNEQPKASENRRNDFDLAFFDEVEAAMRKEHQDES